MPLAILLYWKQIVAGLAIVALLGCGYWFKSVLADNKAMKVTIAQQLKDMTDLQAMNKGLTTAVQVKENELDKYVKLNTRLSKDKQAIQNEYDAYMQEVEDAKIQVTPGHGIDVPYVLKSPGMPVGQGSGSKGSNNPQVPAQNISN